MNYERKRKLLRKKGILMRYYRLNDLGQFVPNSKSTLHSPQRGIRIDEDEDDDEKWLELKEAFSKELGIENWNENR